MVVNQIFKPNRYAGYRVLEDEMRCTEDMGEDDPYHHMIQCRRNESIQCFRKDQLAIEVIETPERDADELG